jgi:hypothetical protein
LPYQTSNNILVAIKRESTTGTAPVTVTGATQVRITDSPGLELRRGIVQSGEKRADGFKTMGRLGNKSVDGSYNGELSVGGATDIMLEAIMRSAFVTAYSVGFATMTTVAVGTNQVVAAGGSWITQGVRVGDVFRLSGTSVSGNHDLNTVVTALTTLTLSVPSGTFTTLAAAATGTITFLRKLTAGATPTRYSHAIEQYDTDVDLSELFLGCRLVGLRLSMRPNQHVTWQASWMGLNRTALATGTSPFYTSPSLTTGLGLIADDSAIRYNGAAVTSFTGFDLNFQITAAGEPVIGSLVSPDIFDNDCMVDGSITGLRSDFSNLTLFDAETEFEMSVKLEVPGSAPKDCLHIFLPRIKLQSLSAPVGGGDGAKVETLGLMLAPKATATGYDATPATFSTSATG